MNDVIKKTSRYNLTKKRWISWGTTSLEAEAKHGRTNIGNRGCFLCSCLQNKQKKIRCRIFKEQTRSQITLLPFLHANAQNTMHRGAERQRAKQASPSDNKGELCRGECFTVRVEMGEKAFGVSRDDQEHRSVWVYIPCGLDRRVSRDTKGE
jgi:predicted RNA-binding protein YlxR (DUF448 family)